MSISKYNGEHYSDLTAYKALSDKEKTKKPAKRHNSIKKVFICSPYSGDTEANVNKTLAYCRFALEKGKFPVAPHLWLPRFLDCSNPAERQLALSFGLWLLNQCGEVWVFGRLADDEIEAALSQRKTVRYFNENMKEIKK